ncbi:hypothetical protein NDJ00_11430 [Vibrio parahaemolyticus]|uniref:hypothetical protein n=1 Tax=Vibrio parahaemolyticus TaxID=670 RepID=UPI00215EB23E|nr:hypothetical protein [Vibrio parahaemolyticus]MCS0114780.1 hypothetical protein [Vibrio parahaemolyticus]
MISKQARIEFFTLAVMHLCMVYILLLANENATYIALDYYGLYAFATLAVIGTFKEKYDFKYGVAALLVGGSLAYFIDIKDVVVYLLVQMGMHFPNPNTIGFFTYLAVSVIAIWNIVGTILKKVKFSFFKMFSSIMFLASFTVAILFHQLIVINQFNFSQDTRSVQTKSILSDIHKKEFFDGYCQSNYLLCISTTGDKFEGSIDELAKRVPSISETKDIIIDVHNTLKKSGVGYYSYTYTNLIDEFFIIETYVNKGASYLVIDKPTHEAHVFFASKIFMYLFQAFTTIWFLFGTMLIAMHQDVINKRKKES